MTNEKTYCLDCKFRTRLIDNSYINTLITLSLNFISNMVFGVKDALYKLGRTLTSTDEVLPSTPEARDTAPNPPELYHTATDSNLFVDSNINDWDDMDMLPPVNLKGYLPTTKNRLLTVDMCDEIRALMPTRIQLYNDWTLLYSLEQHGASLHTLYNNITPDDDLNKRIGYVIVIKDRQNGIFGAYANDPWLPHENKRYYGNGECFLWKLEKVPELVIKESKDNMLQRTQTEHSKWQFVGYPYTGLNEFGIYCTSEFLSMGAGDGHYGLWCDSSLLRGVSYPCDTFGNETLSKEGPKFHINGIEVWRVGS